MPQLVSIRFLVFDSWKSRFRAFQWMGKARQQPWEAPGLIFSKHLGVGKGGFSIWPDWGTYAFMGLFDDASASEKFFEQDPRWKAFSALSHSQYGYDGVPIQGHGTWNGKQPFQFSEEHAPWDGALAVITRASIAWAKSLLFWWNVPASARGLDQQEGLVLAKGVGELPLVEQATFSLWKNKAMLEQFAYKGKNHAPMIRKTRKHQWYKEEMFVRLAVLRTYPEKL